MAKRILLQQGENAVSETASSQNAHYKGVEKVNFGAAGAWDLIAKNSKYFAEHRCDQDMAHVDRHLAIMHPKLDAINARCFPEPC